MVYNFYLTIIYSRSIIIESNENEICLNKNKCKSIFISLTLYIYFSITKKKNIYTY